MGVKLQKIINRKKIDYPNLAGKIIAIDAPNIIMSLFNFARKNPDGSYAGLILDRTQRPISHLYGLLYRVNFYYSKKMFPIFCFDGKVSELKKIITKDYLKDFLFTQRWYEEVIKSGNRMLARQIAMSNEYLWHNIIKESKHLLGALGVPYIDSPASAESQCAYLVKQKVAHFSNSQDFDSLLFGCPFVIQNLSKSLRRKVQGKWAYKKIEPQLLDLQKNLKTLGITIFQLVDMAILIGTDYFPGITNIGPKKALNLIKKYRMIENVIFQEKNNFNFTNLTKDLIKSIRKLFLFPDVNASHETYYWNPPDKPKVLSLLCKEHHLNKKRVKNSLDKLDNNYENGKNYFIHIRKEPHTYQLTIDDLI
ncbi:hypothetical protein LCGC14_1372800 [marine sediment metagenome]|uniref:XPG-I domain-containing protein n=1 Tax=marine sediment metagenome TaxID=412755 RepID=A0A0F9MK66_9ZZZZ